MCVERPNCGSSHELLPGVVPKSKNVVWQVHSQKPQETAKGFLKSLKRVLMSLESFLAVSLFGALEPSGSEGLAPKTRMKTSFLRLRKPKRRPPSR